jgi:hypothetical protein
MLDDKQNNMATAGEERDIVSFIFSDYCNSLEQSARARYKEKCKKCGFEPYTLKPSDFVDDLNGLPEVEYPDLVNKIISFCKCHGFPKNIRKHIKVWRRITSLYQEIIITWN